MIFGDTSQDFDLMTLILSTFRVPKHVRHQLGWRHAAGACDGKGNMGNRELPFRKTRVFFLFFFNFLTFRHLLCVVRTKHVAAKVRSAWAVYHASHFDMTRAAKRKCAKLRSCRKHKLTMAAINIEACIVLILQYSCTNFGYTMIYIPHIHVNMIHHILSFLGETFHFFILKKHGNLGAPARDTAWRCRTMSKNQVQTPNRTPWMNPKKIRCFVRMMHRPEIFEKMPEPYPCVYSYIQILFLRRFA